MRKSILFTIVLSSNMMLLALLALHARYRQTTTIEERLERGQLVRTLRLTDLCLFTEARYTRHPAMADRFAPFQDHPGALEHFPSGSLIPPYMLTPPHQEGS